MYFAPLVLVTHTGETFHPRIEMRNSNLFGRAAVFAALAMMAACGSDEQGEAADSGGAGPVAVPSDDVAAEETLSFGPIDVPPGIERTQCVTRRLGNTAAVKVGSIHNTLVGVSHHLIVYRVSDTEERLEPYDCRPFADVLSGKNGAPLMITQKKDEVLALAEGVAFVLEPQQMIRLEVHYINTTAEDSTIETHSTFQPIAESAFKHEVGFLFAGNLDVDLPAGQTTHLSSFIEAPLELARANFFGFTGHTHRLGTNVVVEMGPRSGPMMPVYDVAQFSWSEPPTIYHDPALIMPSDGRFRLSCDYTNDTDQRVTFGESAEAEMCFFWGYYYPNAGARVCFHTTRSGVSIDSCCPGGLFCS
jgi:hypothetical protein